MSDAPSAEFDSQKPQPIYRLLLFVAGREPNSVLALQNLEAFCRAELEGRYELEVVDVFKDHKLALEHRVLVTPCMVMLAPLPRVMVAGTLRDGEKVRVALRLFQE